MPEKFENLYSLDKAQDEANLVREKIEKGYTMDCTEDEKLIKDEKKEDWKKKYEERKAEIKTPDEKLIKRIGGKKGNAYQDSGMKWMWRNLIENEDSLRNYLKNKTLFDVGCGKVGNRTAAYLTGKKRFWDPNLREFKDGHQFDLKIKNIISVDPFVDLNAKTKSEIDKGRIKEKASQFIKNDGLSFLISQEAGSGNNLTININYALIPDEEYLKRLAQEIFRVTPNDGIFISGGSDLIEREAKTLFPFYRSLGTLVVFAKKDVEGFFQKSK